MKLSEIDSNFASCSVKGVTFNLTVPRDEWIEGFPWEKENEELFCRLPDSIKDEISEPLKLLSTHSAGGVLRFCTDSSALLIKGKFRPFDISHHMALTGVAGFDVKIRKDGEEHLVMNMRPDIPDIVKGKWDFELSCPLEEGMNEYRVYLPLYAGIESLQLGFTEGAKIETAPRHKIQKPILYYGSSITQGGCASRPSTCYTAMVASMVDAEQINLGFSGNAKGEEIVAETIAKLDLSCFVLDYDHNAPDMEHFRRTHEPFFKIVRKAHPNLPIIMMSRPFGRTSIFPEAQERRDIVMQTYLNARNNGDTNVYFIDGMKFFAPYGYELPTVDKCHPTDLGFYIMVQNLLPVMKKALKVN